MHLVHKTRIIEAMHAREIKLVPQQGKGLLTSNIFSRVLTIDTVEPSVLIRISKRMALSKELIKLIAVLARNAPLRY